ncbi:hypothetical protein G6F35_018766 [Rhizopus arrhizus]|nr:hypothetical protein G6F35_018766 [Rhizopus arrhizus]
MLSEDQDHTAALLRNGSVLGAVTTLADPVQGCRIHALGSMHAGGSAGAGVQPQGRPAGAIRAQDLRPGAVAAARLVGAIHARIRAGHAGRAG